MSCPVKKPGLGLPSLQRRHSTPSAVRGLGHSDALCSGDLHKACCQLKPPSVRVCACVSHKDKKRKEKKGHYLTRSYGTQMDHDEARGSLGHGGQLHCNSRISLQLAPLGHALPCSCGRCVPFLFGFTRPELADLTIIRLVWVLSEDGIGIVLLVLLTTTIRALRDLTIVGETGIFETGQVLLDRRGPTLTQSRTLRLVAEIETNHVLTVQFALQVDQADAVTNGFYLLCHNPNTHYQQLAFLLKTRNRGASNTDHRNEVDLEILLAHLFLDIDESRLRHRFGVNLETLPAK